MSLKASDLFLRRTDIELPGRVEEIAALLKEVESENSIHRIDLEMGKPARVWQVVSEDEQPENGVDHVVREARLIELDGLDGRDPFFTVVRMCHELVVLRRRPVFWAVGKDTVLAHWLGSLPGEAQHLLGYPIYEVQTYPMETLVLAGSSVAGADVQDVDVALKAVMEVMDAQQDHDDARGVRAHPQGDDRAVHQVEARPSGVAGSLEHETGRIWPTGADD